MLITRIIHSLFVCSFFLTIPSQAAGMALPPFLPNFDGNPKNTEFIRLIDSLNTKAFDLRHSFPDSSAAIAIRALGISETHHYLKGQAIALNIQGLYHRTKGRMDLARGFFNRSLCIRVEIGDPDLIAEQYLNIGNSLKQTGDLDSARWYFERSFTIQDSLGNIDKSSNALSDIVLVLKAQGDYAQSLIYADRVLQLQRQTGKPSNIARALIRKGEIYEDLSFNAESRRCYAEAIALLEKEEPGKHLATGYNNMGNLFLHEGVLDSAERCYLTSKQIREQKGFSGDLPGTLLNLGIVARLKGQEDLAIKRTNEALKTAIESENVLIQAEAHNQLGEIYMDNDHYDEAKQHFESSLALVGGNTYPVMYLKTLQNLASVASSTSDYASAYKYSEQYALFLDTLNQKVRKAENLIHKQSLEITTLKSQAKIMELESDRTLFKSFAIGIAGVTLALVAVLIVASWKQRERKRNAQIKQQEEIDELMDVHRNQLLVGMIKSQAQERKKIADDLHGNLGGLLAAAKLHLSALEDQLATLSAEENATFNVALDLISNACELTRNIAHMSSDERLARIGFAKALRDLVEKINVGGKIHINLVADLGEKSLDEGFEIEVFRLTQDLLTNVLKHSQAKTATIQLLQKNDRLMIMVEDNGIGFDIDNVQQGTGMGIAMSHNRVEILDGTMTIDSSPNNGCTVIVDLPVQFSEDNK
jgi:two-component system, NarL family, sensor kinase